MKISFTTFACPEWKLEAVIEAAQRHGYQGIEFRTDAGHQHGIEISTTTRRRAEIRWQFEGSGIEPCCLATSLQFVNDDVLDQAPAWIELAADIGCPAIRVFGGPSGSDLDISDVIERTAWHLRHAAESAQSHGVELWLETHDLFNRAVDAAAAVRIADHPAVGISYNNMHPYRVGEPLQTTIEALRGLVRHTHFHDSVKCPNNVIITPMGQGDLPIDEMFQALINTGFEGYFSGEWFYNQYGDHPDESLESYRRDMAKLAQRHSFAIYD